uniref:Uncharacterized protein n=1 Tax=Ciona intestinalis TaxID=7719 RepID=F6YKA5_CIOIN
MNKSALLLLLVIGLLVLTETTNALSGRRRWHGYNQESASVEENDVMMNEIIQKLNLQDE